MHTAACFGLLLHASVFTLALASNDWVQFPGGRLLHTSCIHRHEAGRIEPLAPCQHVHALAAPSVGSGYYGGWSVYSFLPANRSLSHMSATFKVPPKPTSLGPLGLSSLYMYALHHTPADTAASMPVCQCAHPLTVFPASKTPTAPSFYSQCCR